MCTMWTMVTAVGDASRYTRILDCKRVTPQGSPTANQRSEWPVNERMDMDSCAILAGLIVVKSSVPTHQQDCIYCPLNTDSHWSSIEDGCLARARCSCPVVCRHVVGL